VWRELPGCSSNEGSYGRPLVIGSIPNTGGDCRRIRRHLPIAQWTVVMNRRRFFLTPLVCMLPILPATAYKETTTVYLKGDYFKCDQVREIVDGVFKERDAVVAGLDFGSAAGDIGYWSA
jgi:hypothetical protein